MSRGSGGQALATQAAELAQMALDMNEGFMQLIQALVLALGRTGALDTADYARLVTDLRLTQTEEGSMQAAVLDRMLGMLVDRPDVLVRRAAMAVVELDEPNPPLAGPG